jgi:antirestriction protein ArdC
VLFLCAGFSIDDDLRHAGYIASRTGLLTTDPQAFFTARSKAKAAAHCLRRHAVSEAAAA